jgi:hypothetical protein
MHELIHHTLLGGGTADRPWFEPTDSTHNFRSVRCGSAGKFERCGAVRINKVNFWVRLDWDILRNDLGAGFAPFPG